VEDADNAHDLRRFHVVDPNILKSRYRPGAEPWQCGKEPRRSDTRIVADGIQSFFNSIQKEQSHVRNIPLDQVIAELALNVLMCR
jgi:hypothetical protein